MAAMVLAVCGDPGGAAAVAPVVEQLQRDGRVCVRSVLYRQAREVWQRRGLAFESLADDLSDAALGDLAQSANALLLGTSVNGVDYERRLIALAPAHSVAVLDFWSNYAARFRLAGQPLIQPERICVMDEQARQDLVAEGFDPACLAITGQPALDDLAAWRARWTESDTRKMRERLGVRGSERLVLFASQPLVEFYGSDRLSTSRPGYDQHGVIWGLLDALETVAAERRCGIRLVIRPHPREDRTGLDAYARERGRLRIVVSQAEEARAAVMAADVVCGMTTMLLVESCQLGKIAVSLQPGLRGADQLPTNRAGWSRLVTRLDEIAGVMDTALFDTSANDDIRRRLAAIAPDGQAAARVAAEVYTVLRDERSL